MNYDDCTLDDAASALMHLDSNDFELWYRAGMALRGEFGDLAFDVWDSWSQGFAKYSSKECRQKWASFKGSSSRGSVSMGTIFKLALDKGWRFTQTEMTPAQKKAFAIEQAARREQLAAQRVREDAEIAAWYEIVADACERIWAQLHTVGKSPYLGRKKVGGYGVRFAHAGLIIETIEATQAINLISGAEHISAFFKARTEDTKFFYIKPGSVIVPLRDAAGRLMNLQIITETGKKLFMRNGRKTGLFHFFGEPVVGGPVGIAEGYATAASAHMARGWPMAVALDAGNLPVVAAELARVLPKSVFFILADDDPIGISKGAEAAQACNGCLLVPNFAGVARG